MVVVYCCSLLSKIGCNHLTACKRLFHWAAFITPVSVGSSEFFPELNRLFGITMPLATVVEHNASNQAQFDHIPNQAPPQLMLYTDEITRHHPVTRGVRGIWYPNASAFNSAFTAPLLLDSHWSALVRGSATSVTVAVNLSIRGFPVPPHSVQTAGVRSPALFAVRSFGEHGRL